VLWYSSPASSFWCREFPPLRYPLLLASTWHGFGFVCRIASCFCPVFAQWRLAGLNSPPSLRQTAETKFFFPGPPRGRGALFFLDGIIRGTHFLDSFLWSPTPPPPPRQFFSLALSPSCRFPSRSTPPPPPPHPPRASPTLRFP